MIRETIKLGQHNFICDLYKSGTDIAPERKEYVMVRNFKLKEGTLCDNDILIIDKDLIHDDVLSEDGNYGMIAEEGNCLSVYPIPDEIERFSSSIYDFNPDFNSQVVYEFYDGDGNVKPLLTDKIRIYHPRTKTKDNRLIVYLDSYIQGIHFHYFCSLYEYFCSKSETEMKLYNDIYSEYIEISIPNIEDLISKDTFFYENSGKKGVRNASGSYSSLVKIQADEEDGLCSTYLFAIPFSVTSEGNKEYYVHVEKNIENNYTVYPLNITLYPYDSVSDNNVFVMDSVLMSNSDVFVAANKVKASAKFEFNADNGRLECVCRLIDDCNAPITKALYEKYNNVDFDAYSDGEYDCEDPEYDFTEGADNSKPVASMDIELSSDAAFKHIIYRDSVMIDADTLKGMDDGDAMMCSFPIKVFKSWDQVPEIVCCRVSFTDTYLGTQTMSNFIALSKEHLKYIIYGNNADGNKYRIDLKGNDDMNFVDKIQCTVKVADPSASSQAPTSPNYGTKVIYKPIFYKTQTLQSTQLRKGLKQNIGINLSNYLSKVETFYITFGSVQFPEIARTEGYVLFSVETNKLSETSGTYHISNQDDEYISSGSWTLID